MSRRRILVLCCVVYGGLWMAALIGMFTDDRWTLVGLGGVCLALAAYKPLSRRSEGLEWVVRDRMQGFRKLLGKGRTGKRLGPYDQDLITEARESAYWGLSATAVALLWCQFVAAQVLEVQQSMQGFGLVVLGIGGLTWCLPTLTINALLRDPPEHPVDED